MTTFVFTELVPSAKVVSAALGANSSGKFADVDVGKAVKLGTANNYVLCAAGNDIDGFVNTIEPFTVNDGFSFGGVLMEGRIYAKVASDQGGTPMAVGDYVVAGAPTALGTADTGVAGTEPGTAGMGRVKTGAPTRRFWRCIRIVTGTGVAGDVVLLECI